MATAVFDNSVIAKSDDVIWLEGNAYFPPDSIDMAYLRPSHMKSLCFWKGVASYFHVVADGNTARNAAWVYKHPSPLARKIKGHVAFWQDVRIAP